MSSYQYLTISVIYTATQPKKDEAEGVITEYGKHTGTQLGRTQIDGEQEQVVFQRVGQVKLPNQMGEEKIQEYIEENKDALSDITEGFKQLYTEQEEEE